MFTILNYVDEERFFYSGKRWSARGSELPWYNLQTTLKNMHIYISNGEKSRISTRVLNKQVIFDQQCPLAFNPASGSNPALCGFNDLPAHVW